MSRMAEVLAEHGIYGFDGSEFFCSCQSRGLWFTSAEYAAHLADALTADGFGDVREAKAQALLEAAESMDGDAADSFYYTRKRELAHPYSKPMHPEHWGELDGIESAAKFLRDRAATIKET